MNIAHTPHHVHMEFDFDTYRLMQIVLAASAVVVLLMLLSAATQRSDDSNLTLLAPAVAASTSSPPMQAYVTQQNYWLFSTQNNAGITGDEDQPYYIPSPDL